MTALRHRRWLLPLLLGAVLAALLLPAGHGQEGRPAGRKYALLVGVNRYEHAKLKTLKYAENDAKALAAVLRRAGYRVVLLTGSEKKASLQATKANIEAQLKTVLEKCRRGDTVLLGFAGHGLQFEGKKDAFFCPSDARPFKTRTDSLVSLKKVYEQLDESLAGVKLVLVDACRNDPLASRSIDIDTAPRPPRGIAALYSCSSGERAFETEKLGGGHGVFFHFVLQGLRGEAKNRKGAVTWASLVEYVREQVSDEVPKVIGGGARQTPHLMADERGKSPVLLDARLLGVALPGFKALFNGRDLTGWQVHGGRSEVWQVKDGVLSVVGGRRGIADWLMTRKTYADFELRLEFRVSRRGNSGVGLRCPLGTHPARQGMEIQILDDLSEPGLKPIQQTGSIAQVVAPRRLAAKPLGEWNRYRIVCQGRQVSVELNGETVVDVNLDDYRAFSKINPGILRRQGHIGLQSWEGRVDFRNIFLKEL
jgi:hypothetical protein